MSCGEIKFLEGGTLKNSSMIGGSVTYATITDSLLDACEVKNLKSVDGASAEKIADAIATLPADKLQALVKALFDALVLSGGSDTPDTTKMQGLPTLMFGDSRRGMLGAPDAWVAMGGKLIPAYTVADGITNVG